MTIWNRIRKEPALLMALLKAAFVVGLAFGLQLTDTQREALMGLAAVIAGLGAVTRSLVTPTAKLPPDSGGT